MLLASGAVWCLFFLGRLPGPVLEDRSSDPPPKIQLLALVLVVYLIGQSLFTRWNSPPNPPAQNITINTLHWVILTGALEWGLLLGLLLTTPHISLRDYGFRIQDWHWQLAVGGLAFLASLLPVYSLLLASSPLRSTETLHPFLKLLRENPGADTVLWIALSVMVVAPLVEELIYRVVLQSALLQWLPVRVAWPMTAVIFSAVHGWPDMIPLLPLALVLGGVYYRFRSYLASVTTHALFNTWMLIWALLVPPGG